MSRERTAIPPLILLLAAVAMTNAHAQSPGRFEVTPFGAATFGGTFEDIDMSTGAELSDSASLGLVLDLRESDNTQWELIYARQSTEVDPSDAMVAAPEIDVDIQYLQLGGTYLGEGDHARPYVAATLGGTHISPQLSGLGDDTFWSASIGAGLQIFPTSHVGVRLEARVWGTLLTSSTDLFCASGSQGGVCAITVDGDVLWQFSTFAGVVFRF